MLDLQQPTRILFPTATMSFDGSTLVLEALPHAEHPGAKLILMEVLSPLQNVCDREETSQEWVQNVNHYPGSRVFGEHRRHTYPGAGGGNGGKALRR